MNRCAWHVRCRSYHSNRTNCPWKIFVRGSFGNWAMLVCCLETQRMPFPMLRGVSVQILHFWTKAGFKMQDSCKHIWIHLRLFCKVGTAAIAFYITKYYNSSTSWAIVGYFGVPPSIRYPRLSPGSEVLKCQAAETSSTATATGTTTIKSSRAATVVNHKVKLTTP